MDQFDREDSSNYTGSQPPTQVQPAEPVNEQPPRPVLQPEKPKRSKAPLILTLLLLLALAVAGTFGWMWYQQNGEVDNVRADLSSAKNKISQLESSAKAESTVVDKTEIKEEPISDNEAVVTALSAYAHGQGGTETSKVTVTVNKIQAPFAAASFGDGTSFGGRGLCIMKESDDIWMVLYCAQGDSEYTLKLDEMFKVPASIKQ